MKRSLLLGIIGFVAATSSSHGNGGIYISNYNSPYNGRVLWGFGPRAGQPVLSTEGVNLTIWYGEGVLTAEQLLMIGQSTPTTLNALLESYGYAGYYGSTLVSLAGWSPGETWTFQIRASGNSVFGVIDPNSNYSALWTERDNIHDIGGMPPGPPGDSQNSLGLVLTPEPSTFALTGLGLSGWMFFRRRTAC